MAICLLQHPAQVRHLRRWWVERHASPVDLGVPWWPYSVVAWLAGELTPGARVVEFGAGGSTVWLAKLGAHVKAAEFHDEWARRVREAAPSAIVIACPADSYPRLMHEEADATLDLVTVDGGDRVECVRCALPKVRPGGLLLLDDSQFQDCAPAIELLQSWERRDFWGLKPSQLWPARTSVWRRPA